MEPNKTIALMEAQVERTGWPKNYRKDFDFHDKAATHAYAPKSFLWILRENGTHLIILDDLTDEEQRFAKKYFDAIINVCGYAAVLIFKYDNDILRIVDIDTAKESIKASAKENVGAKRRPVVI